MGQQKNADMSMENVEIKKVKEPQVQEPQVDEQGEEKTAKKTPKKSRQRSQKYQAVRAQVDKTRHYDPFSAVELVKKLSYSKFPGTITAHLVLKDNFQGEQANFEFPHQTGKTLKVEVADDKTLDKIEAGEIDFDVLLAKPSMMSKLAKHAPILGPQGLMPNPKQGTLLKKPEERKKELEAGKITLRTEREAPLMHVVIGDAETETKKLVENLQALIEELGHKLRKVSLAATMSPGIKVELEQNKAEA